MNGIRNYLCLWLINESRFRKAIYSNANCLRVLKIHKKALNWWIRLVFLLPLFLIVTYNFLFVWIKPDILVFMLTFFLLVASTDNNNLSTRDCETLEFRFDTHGHVWNEDLKMVRNQEVLTLQKDQTLTQSK